MITYILKSGITLLLMYVLYWCFLRKEKLFIFSRFFFLASIILALVVPFVSVPVNFNVPHLKYDLFTTDSDPLQSSSDQTTNIGAPVEGIAEAQSSSINISTIFFGICMIVSTLFLIRFARNLYLIVRKRSVSEKLDFGNYEIILSQDDSCPCCFLKSIFLNREDYHNNQIDQELIKHELEHAKQLHTIDVLFIEVLKIFFWFNPLIYLFDRAIRINHEYLADNAVADHHFDLSVYAHKLVNLVTIRSNIPLTSSSNHSFTKKRIFMLTKSKPEKLHAGSRILSTLLLMLLVFISLSFQNSGREVRGFVVNKYGKHLPGAEISVQGKNNRVTSDKMGHFVLKSVPENAAITISSENYISQSVSPVYTSEMVIRLEVNMPIDEMKKKIADYLPVPGSNPLIVINGVAKEKLSMADIDPTNHVASLKIFTGYDAVTRFGEKARNGAIEIITEPVPAAEKSKTGPPVDSPEFKEKTLVLIDGIVYTGDIKDIPNDGTKSMYVGNYTPEYDKYGFKGKEKVIEFKTTK